ITGNFQGSQEVGARRLEVLSLQLVLVGVGNRMDDEIEAAPTPGERGKEAIEAFFGGYVGVLDEITVEAVGKRPHALAERLALVGEGECRAIRVQRLGDTPAERALVGDPHDEALLTRHQRHRLPQCSPFRSSYTNERVGVIKVGKGTVAVSRLV